MNRDRWGSALVVGGGIGGLATAVELRRAGFEVRVFERRDALGEVNTGFLLWSFAVRRLRALGLGAGLDRIGRPLERLVTKAASGRTLSDTTLAVVNERSGAPSYDVHRAGLQDLLADAVGEHAIQTGAACASVTPAGEVRLEDGRTVAGDVVVGADGVSSVVRRQVAGNVRLERGGFGAWRGVADIGTDLVPEGVHIRIMGGGGLFGVGRLDERAVRWYLGGRVPDHPAPRGPARKAEALSLAGRWAQPAPAVLEATAPDAFLFNDAPRARPFRPWTAGRIVLIGDAAHPTLPTLATGGGMALEDAAALGESLRSMDDVPQALRRYEARRRRPAGIVQRTSVLFAGALGVRRPRAIALRDAGFAPPFDRIQDAAIRWLMRGP